MTQALYEAKNNVTEAMGQLREFEELLDALVDVGQIGGAGGVIKASKRFLNPVCARSRTVWLFSERASTV